MKKSKKKKPGPKPGRKAMSPMKRALTQMVAAIDEGQLVFKSQSRENYAILGAAIMALAEK